MYTIRKYRENRSSRYRYNHEYYGYEREPGPKPTEQRLIVSNAPKLSQMRSVNRNR